MSDEMTLSVPGAGLRIDPRLGMLTALWFETDGRRIAPLHQAPWLDEPAVQVDAALPLVERRLAGDFFCAPFAMHGVASLPIHGWPANSPWEVEEITQTGKGGLARLSLLRPVQGARLTKVVELSAHDPLVYQTHDLTGGDGPLTLGHHPMLRMAGRGWMSYSPKRLAQTPAQPLEPGGGWLTYAASSTDLTAFPGRDGPADLTRYPQTRGHEDFVTLIEAPGSRLGWTVVIREDEDDMVLFLKDPAVLPVTMLWFSNGGRSFAPWNGRHTGVLGIEDGCAAGLVSLAAAAAPNPVSETGVATVLHLAEGQRHRIRHVIGAVPRPAGWQQVRSVQIDGASLVLTEVSGDRVVLAYRRGFFGR